MSIKKDEINFSDGERKIKVQEVFLEKSDKPTSTTGARIPRGVLMLTNRRLFFFNKEKIESLGKVILRFIPGVVASGVAGELAGNLASTLSEFAEDGIDYLFEKSGNEKYIERFLDNKDSFVIPVERIVTCEKLGSWFDYWVGIPGFKKRYVRIGILDDVQAKINYYCIYCNKPINPLAYTKAINYKEWFEEINTIKNTNASLCGQGTAGAPFKQQL
jgi:hypothetical protein